MGEIVTVAFLLLSFISFESLLYASDCVCVCVRVCCFELLTLHICFFCTCRRMGCSLVKHGAAERLEAIQQRVKRLAEDVVGDELSADDPLLEPGNLDALFILFIESRN